MSDQIKFFKVASLPGVLEANSFYYVVNGDYAESYLTTSGLDSGQNPVTVVAKKIGNSAMIEEVAGELVTAATELKVAADIDAMYALNLTYTGLILVLDASIDSTVSSGAATYVYNSTGSALPAGPGGIDGRYIKIAEYESLDVVVNWTDIVGRPTSTPAQIDAAVQRSVDNAAAIAQEILDRTAGDATVQAAVNAEVTRATTAEGVLATDIAALDTRVDALEATGATVETRLAAAEADIAALETQAATFVTDIAALDTRADTLETDVAALETNLAAETLARTGADTALQSEIDATQAGAGLSAGGVYTASSGATYIATATSLKDADDKLDTAISDLQSSLIALGNAFNYVGAVEGGADAGAAFDLETLPAGSKDAGDYFKVTVAGWFVVGTGTAFYANIGDGLVWNMSNSVDKIDNTDSNVAGTAGFISVDGSADTGFIVDIDSSFKTRVSDAEADIVALEGRAGTLETDVATLDTRVDTLETDVNAVETRVGTLETDLAALDTRVDTLETDLAALDTRVDTLETDVAALDTRVDTLETDVAALDTRVDDVETLATHANRTQLDLIGEDVDGNLTYNGNIVASIWSSTTW